MNTDNKKASDYEAPSEEAVNVHIADPVVNKKFKFVYIDPASMTHAFYFDEVPQPGAEVKAYNAAGERLTGIRKFHDLKIENVVPLQ